MPQYFDYSGADGCSPPNIGHCLGGDLPQFQSNTIEGMYGIASLQHLRCFKNWEFDLAETLDGLALAQFTFWQDRPISKMRLSEIPVKLLRPVEYLQHFGQIEVIRPIVIDLQIILSECLIIEARSIGETVRQHHPDAEVWFTASEHNAARMPNVRKIFADKFDLMIYGGKGNYCAENYPLDAASVD